MSRLLGARWMFSDSSSDYRIVWWYDEEAKDTSRRIPPFSAVSQLDTWFASRGSLLRQLGEALRDTHPQELSAIRTERWADSRKGKALVAEALRTGRLVVVRAIAEEHGQKASPAELRGKPSSGFAAPVSEDALVAYSTAQARKASPWNALLKPSWFTGLFYTIPWRNSAANVQELEGTTTDLHDYMKVQNRVKTVEVLLGSAEDRGSYSEAELRGALSAVLDRYTGMVFTSSEMAFWTRNVVFKTRFEVEPALEDEAKPKKGKRRSPAPEGTGGERAQKTAYLARVGIGKAGEAKVELMGKLPSVVAPRWTKESATDLLKKEYDISVLGAGKTWTSLDEKMTTTTKDWTGEELEVVITALSLAPAEDRRALREAQLYRVAQIPGNTGGERTAAYRLSFESPHSVTVDDDTFRESPLVYGSARNPYSSACRIILHELGHAVEKQAYRQAALAVREAKGRTDALVRERDRVFFQDKTLRLHRLIAVAGGAQGSGEPVTRYAKESWEERPSKPQELFAEAYWLWLLEPDFLKEHYPALHEFFETGQYRV
ncbi:hypothetical protein [Archangium sp.]|uniref:hypothetical protein n=1 Tax=Archangium sp. TaxID=1872627 RepID=UPI00286BF639|nr:hypothetical protein [Archangium sp.]